jgi:hypothetical protein
MHEFAASRVLRVLWQANVQKVAARSVIVQGQPRATSKDSVKGQPRATSKDSQGPCPRFEMNMYLEQNECIHCLAWNCFILGG